MKKISIIHDSHRYNIYGGVYSENGNKVTNSFLHTEKGGMLACIPPRAPWPCPPGASRRLSISFLNCFLDGMDVGHRVCGRSSNNLNNGQLVTLTKNLLYKNQKTSSASAFYYSLQPCGALKSSFV